MAYFLFLFMFPVEPNSGVGLTATTKAAAFYGLLACIVVHLMMQPGVKKADEPVQSSSVSSDFTSKLLNLENPSPADNKIASLMETCTRHATTVPEITSNFTTTIPLPPSFFNPLPQQATPTTSKATTLFPSLLDFSSVFRQEAQDEKNSYIELINMSMRAIIKEEKNFIESLEAAVLTRSSSQPKSYYEAAASLSEFDLTKILLDKMEESKSHLRADYKKKLYDALVESYNTDKYLFNTYGEVCTLKRSRGDNNKDRDPSARSDRGMKRRKSSKEAESSRDSRSKEKKYSSTSKDTSHSQHKHSGKSAHAEEPSHTFDDSGVQQDQEFDTCNNDEQPANKETWISQVARDIEPRTSFDEIMDTFFDFSTFFLNRLNIKDLTQEILVGPAFKLLKGTCKSLTKLEYHLKECSKATTKRLNWHNPEGKLYPFDLSKPLLLIRDHQGRQVIPQDFFINNDLKYLKGGDLSRRYLLVVVDPRLG
ncbi:hypothetical protein Tco_0099265 [Tanacetum coccineum]